MTKHLLLNYVLGTQTTWRHPDFPIGAATSLDHYLEQAGLAERGLFDLVFLVDDVALFPDPDVALVWPLSPIQVMTALATHTTHIGLVATIGTAFVPPYELARSLASLDHLSGGRAGWNIVTSASGQAAANHGLPESLPRAERYERATECLDAVIQLWHAWEADALLADPATGDLVSPDRIHAVNFRGDHVRVRGPLSLPRSPQVVPVLFQAGPSPAGRELAARYADLVYATLGAVEDSRAYRADLRSRAEAAGRGADAVRLLPGIMPYVKSTEAEARSFHRELMELNTPASRYREVAGALGVDLRSDDHDATVPAGLVAEATRRWPWIVTRGTVDPSGVSWRELAHAVHDRYGHRVVVDTPERIADLITDGFVRGAYDGVSISAPPLTTGLADFVDLVVPILQERGVHKREYARGSLRERLGLPITQRVDRSSWTPHYAS
ncbi:NtaA/DmoA family FMN-dependent monooxygenase [Pseudonocardia spinosispora]|uniref:NtaA/DmoA family FMN-dependent monooxygenase n=1 Tax=Pseudonocardia spinosispora TaxID=103441 RepID=UPI0004042620|nr:NtaA/DmoA family FMN-dependent monooxygenase [Pseudonocardia spinosispora]